MAEDMKRIALRAGGDWTDAECTHILIPSHVILEEALASWNQWYHHEYLSALRQGEEDPYYITFPKYLCQHYGARDDAEVVQWWYA